MTKELKIPTNHGNLTPGEITDHLSYASYKTQRDNGASPELLAKWYNDHRRFEQIYQSKNN